MEKKVNRGGWTTKWFAAVVFFTFSTVGTMFAQTQAMRVAVPYSFTFGSKELPAGSYTFSVNGFQLVVQSSSNERFSTTIITQISGPGEILEAGSLVFDTTGGRHILTEVWIPGTDGQLLLKNRRVHKKDVLLASFLNQTRTTSGKSTYNQTCGVCHGSDGRGNERADRFFQVTIPRLSSEAIQSQSDAKLKELINAGSAVMPPVEINENGFRHRLPPQDVDAVIAYVRTLKQ